MSKHTPGPWRVRPCVEMDAIGVVEQGGRVVARTRGAYGPEDSAENAANARLIAAAPDMAAELEAAAKQFRFYEQQHRAKGTADAAAKAEVNRTFAERIEALLSRAAEPTP